MFKKKYNPNIIEIPSIQEEPNFVQPQGDLIQVSAQNNEESHPLYIPLPQ